MHIGILQTGPVPDEMVAQFGQYTDRFARFLDGNGFSYTTWEVHLGDFPPAPDAAEGWLITGSRYGVYEDHDWLPPLRQFIRDVMAQDRPMVGVCFGHQVIAQAMGARVEKFDGGWVVGAQDYAFGSSTLRLNAWHQDQVLSVPDGAEIIAQQANCAIAALHYPGHALTVQPHPEFGADFVLGLAAHRGPGIIPDALLAQVHDRAPDPLDNTTVAQMVAQFFYERRLP